MSSRRLVGRAALVVGLLLVTLATARSAGAHAPHDDIADIAISPAFAEDQTVFVVSRNKLLRSQDGGLTFHESVTGLGDETEFLRHVAVAQSDPARVYLSSRGNGMYASTDGGDSWRAASTGLVDLELGELAVSPTDPNLVLVGGIAGGLQRSTDGAATWQLSPEAGRVTALAFLADGSAALLGRPDGRVYRSGDGGASWQLAFTTEGRDGVTAISSSAGAGGNLVVVVGTAAGELYRSEDAGATFEPLVADGMPAESVSSVAFSPTFAEDDQVWVSGWDTGPYVSDDGGATFEGRAEGTTTDEQAEAVEQPQFRDVVIASDGSAMFLGGFDGLFRSSDGGEQWSPVETLTEYIAGLAVSPAFADDSTLVLSTYVKGTMLSTDGGDSWELVNEGLEGRVGPGNKFAPLYRMHNVVFSPDFAQDDTVFTATWVRMARSTDGGRSWEQIQIGPAPEEPGLLRQFVLAVSPQFAEDGTIYAATRQGEVFRSTERGDDGSWEQIGTLPGRIRSVALSPDFAADQVMYAGTVDGVYRSEDGGATWDETGVFIEQQSSGLENDSAAQIALSPGYGVDGTVFAGTDSGLFASRDGGATWAEVVTGPLTAESRIEAVSVSPAFADDQLVLVSTRDAGLTRSTDGGATFEAIAPELLADNHIIADFSNPTSAPIQFSPAFADDSTVFAYAQTDVLRSTDGGTSWEELPVPTGTEVLELIGGESDGGETEDGGESEADAPAADEADTPWIETPIGNLSVKRILAAVGAGAIAFLGIHLLAKGTDTPMAKRMRIGAVWAIGAFAVAILVLAA